MELLANIKWVEKYRDKDSRKYQANQNKTDINNAFVRALDNVNSSLIILALLLDETKSEQKELFDNCMEMKELFNNPNLTEEDIASLKITFDEISTQLRSIFRDERKKLSALAK